MLELLKKYYKVGRTHSFPSQVEGFSRSDIAKVINLLKLNEGAEIGIRGGRYSKVLCQYIENCKLLCIDNWKESNSEGYYELAKKRLKPYNVTFIRKTSMEAVLGVAENSLDFVYIDANHHFDFFMQDLIEWVKRVRSGGIIAGHDYQFQDVKDAVAVYVKAHDVKEWFLTGSDHWTSFFWRKR